MSRDRGLGGDRRRDEDFVRNVLGKTSGSPCARAVGLLPQLVDHELPDLDRRLVQSHLEHCEDCRAVAVTLGWLGTLLPAMAELDPGPDFTAGVLARTSGATSPAQKAARAGATIGPAGLMDRVGRWWEKQIFKPRFALQFAYAATVILVLLTALPVSPFRSAPEKALVVVQAGPGSIPVVGAAEAALRTRAGHLQDRALTAAGSRWEALGAGLDRRGERSRAPRGELALHLQDAWARARSGELSQAGYELMQASRAGRQAWATWWRGEAKEKS